MNILVKRMITDARRNSYTKNPIFIVVTQFLKRRSMDDFNLASFDWSIKNFFMQGVPSAYRELLNETGMKMPVKENVYI